MRGGIKKQPVHRHERIKLAFFVVASLFSFVLAWIVFKPFALLLVTAIVAAIVVTPFQLWLMRTTGQDVRFCAFLATFATLLAVGLPLALGTVFLLDELQEFHGLDPRLFQSELWRMLPRDLQSTITSLNVQSLYITIAKYLSVSLADILASTTRFFFMSALFFVSLFYMLAERETLHRKILAMSPLTDQIDDTIIKRLTTTVRAVVLGNVVVGFVQGLLAGAGFLIFGVPNALLWGMFTLLAAQIPLVGTGIITVPAVLYLTMTDHLPEAIGLTLWGIVLVGTIDNILKPKLVQGKTNLHPLLILLSMLGGMQSFGPIGLVLGPAVLAAALGFLGIYEAGILAGAFHL